MEKRDILLSLLSGILLILSFPNFDLEFLAWFGFVPLLYAIDGKTRLHAFTLAFLTGFVSYRRRFVKSGADFLVTITNDAWFGRTSAPHQHFTIAVFRAVENRVFIAKAANTGITGFIDPKGKIVRQGEVFTEEAMNGTIRLSKKKTLHALYGDVIAWICSGFSLLLLGYTFLQKQSKKE